MQKLWFGKTTSAFVIAASLSACGSIRNTPRPDPAPVVEQKDRPTAVAPNLTIPAYGRHLYRPDGRPFFYLADAAWDLLATEHAEKIQDYFSVRASQGFSVVQTALVSMKDGTPVRGATGDMPFIAGDWTRPNPAYFDFVQRMVADGNQRGLVLALAPVWFGSASTAQGDATFTETMARAYGKYLGERFADLDIVWILTAAHNPRDASDRQVSVALAEALKAGDGGRHLMTYLPAAGSSSSDFFHLQPWLAFNEFHSGQQAPNMPVGTFVADGYERNPAKPVLDGTSAFEGYPYDGNVARPVFSPYFVRKLAYQALLSGAAGHTYGQHRHDANATIAMPGSVQVGALRRLFESRPFEKLVPDSRLLVRRSEDDGESAAIAEDGSFAFIYSPIGRSVTVDLSRFRGGAVEATRWDPRTGQIEKLGRYSTGQPGEFSFGVAEPNRDRDHLLILDAVDAGYPEVGARLQRPPALPDKVDSQYKLLDGVFAFRDDGFLTDVVPPNPPRSWTGAENLKAGVLHLRIEVKALPRKADPTTLLFRIGSGEHSDRSQIIVYGDGKILFDKPGVFRYTIPVTEHHPLVGESRFQWNRAPAFFQVAVADARGNRVSKWEQELARFEGEKKRHLPLKARVTALLVAPSQQFTAPAYW